ncbi:MAG: pilus assembly protein PilY [Betaproteobacteria bacterium]|nr:pilus assembly protein PilY [Betaproteobacteria bacterium]
MKTSRFTRNLLCAAAWLAAATVALGQIAPVDVTKGPLFAAATRVNPNMVLDLSVEFPTVGAAYNIDVFDPAGTYIGYWDHKACYKYNASGYFYRSANAGAGGTCDGTSFSGNMMNWAASSAIDMLRYALTGGDRVVDTTSQTVLQRAYLSTSPDFYNSSNFRSKTITANASLYTPYSDKTVYIANCRNQIFFGTSKGGSCSNPGNNGNRGSFIAAVEVCTTAEGPVRSDLCSKYPSGSYKPTGTMQLYADKMRFAAFGYLNNSTQSRYAPVLRGEMKYVGPKAYNSTSNEIVNPAPEWDATTGIFVANPLSDGSGNSGVVNYLNKFGRTGTAGAYKTYDDIGELYYEAIRYLQGKQPSPQLTSPAVTNAEKDGFMAYTTWKDPIVQSCQKNYIITVGDINTWFDKTIPGNTRSDGNDQTRAVEDSGKVNELDVMKWTRLVGGFETNAGMGYTDSQGRAQTTLNNPNTNGGLSGLDTRNTGAGGASYYISGLAYWANTQPIRADYPKMRVKTFTLDVNEYGNGTISGTQRNSQLYLAGKYGGFNDVNGDGNPFVTVDSMGLTVTDNSEWANGVDSDGLPKPANYFIAGIPQQMINAIRNIFANVANDSGTISSASISTNKLDSGGGFVYVPRFSSGSWSGTVQSFSVSVDLATSVVTFASSPSWDAGVQLTGTTAASAVNPASRNIFTMLPNGTGAQFKWADLDASQQTLLNTEFYSGSADGLGSDRVDYLRGVRSKEAGKGGPFRNRTSVMGDIINSGPLFVSKSGSKRAQGPGYSTFLKNLSRPNAVYVGTNAGMVHAFNADTGAELFAYVPAMLINRLSSLTSPNYVHAPFVDAQLVSGDAQIGGNWKTILAGGLGGGAQGVFALDITNPQLYGTGAGVVPTPALFEFTDKDDPDMGYVTQTPEIVKIKTGTNQYGWYLAVASGYDNYQADGNANTNGQSALFLLSLDKASGVAWTKNVNYFKVVVPNTDTTLKLANALMGLGTVTGSQGEVTTAYAGDTLGNVWKFDLTGGPTAWNAASALAFGGKPLFTATDSFGVAQPITIKPKTIVGPNGSTIVTFGTGKFMENSDLLPSSYQTQSMYGVWDNGKNSKMTRTDLVARTVTATGGGLSNISGTAFVYTDTKPVARGWYFDFPKSGTVAGVTGTGERQVTETVLSGGQLYFNTLKPDVDVCGNTGGGNTCAINPLSGLSQAATCDPSTVGLLASPLVVQLGDVQVSASRSQGNGTFTTRTGILSTGTQAGKVSVKQQSTTQSGWRASWREVVGFKDLMNP